MTMSESCLSELLNVGPLGLPWLCMRLMTMSESCLSELPCYASEIEECDSFLGP